MRILKNVILSVLIGHLCGFLACLAGAFFALKMPNGTTSSLVFGLAACTVGTVAMAVASKRLSSGSVVCALLCGALYSILSFTLGSLFFDKNGFGWIETVMLAQSFAFPLALCFSGITFTGRRRRSRYVAQKIHK